MNWIRGLFLLVVWFFSVFAPGLHALEPEEILVLVNENSTEGLRLGQYYMQKRGVPSGRLLKVRVTDQESVSRKAYDEKIAAPLKNFLERYDTKHDIRSLVLMYGMPLRIMGDGGVLAEDRRASVDSEAALVRLDGYETKGWVPNPYFLRNQSRRGLISKKDVLMVSRLDASMPKIVKRIIDESIEAEERGLVGRAYFDARWDKPDKEKELSGYERYDRSIHLAAEKVEKSQRMPVVLDKEERLFQRGEAPWAALYCGWYSLAEYVDAFAWQPGAVGYHIASSECVTLKKEGSRVWCKRMLEKGVVATIGPVGEPYVQAFPLPEIFFSYLVKGDLSLAECYLIASPFLSWKMVLVGDPLYRPFKAFVHRGFEGE